MSLEDELESDVERYLERFDGDYGVGIDTGEDGFYINITLSEGSEKPVIAEPVRDVAAALDFESFEIDRAEYDREENVYEVWVSLAEEGMS